MFTGFFYWFKMQNCARYPIISVAKMMEHTSIKTTQIYAKVMDHKISENMENLRQKLYS